MKRILTLALALLLTLGLSVTAFADVLWIPESDFLYDHMDQCQRTDRSYRALTEVKIYESPESGKLLWTIPEGDAWHIYYTYQDADGNLWGCVEDTNNGETGWLPLAYMELVYDYISFEEDYGHLFEYPDTIRELDETCAGLEVWFWDYPGSSSGYAQTMEADYMPSFDCLYTDAEGRVWGYVAYHMGIRNSWVCLDDPTAEFSALFPEGTQLPATEPDETEPSLPAEEIKPPAQPFPMGLTVAIIGCVCITIVLLTRKKRSK